VRTHIPVGPPGKVDGKLAALCRRRSPSGELPSTGILPAAGARRNGR
jgi:hypothetical protein